MMLFAKENIEDIIKLSPMQESIYFEYLLHPEGDAYHEHIYYYLDGQFDVPFLNKAVNRLIMTHPTLRVVFRKKLGHGLLQIILKQRPVEVVSLDFADDWEARFEELKTEDKARKYDLAKDELFRLYVINLPDNKSILFLSHHHIIMDGWSNSLFIRQLADQYKAEVEGSALRHQKAASFAEYVRWINYQSTDDSVDYWKSYLATYRSSYGLSAFAIPEGDKKPYDLQKQAIKLTPEQSQQVQSQTANWKITLNTYFQTIWGVLLAKYYQTDDVVFGSVVTDRPAEISGVDDILGLFINTVPVRLNFTAEDQLIDVLQASQLTTAESKVHQYLPTAKIQSLSEVKNKLIDHILVFENYASQDEAEEETSSQWPTISKVEVVEQTSYDLNVMIVPGDEIEIRLEFNANRFDQRLIGQLLHHYQYLLVECLADARQKIGDIYLLNETDQHEVLHDFNDTKADFPNKTLHALFEQQVRLQPANTAIRFGDQHLSYSKFDQRVNQMANLLAQYKPQPGDLIGVLMERSPRMYVAIMAILKSGAAYVPIDPMYPEERVNFILNDADIKLCIKDCATDLKVSEQVSCIGFEDFEVLNQWPAVFKSHESASTDLAYVIYTSGSTGMPKGAMLRHDGVANRIHWMWHHYRFSTDDVILQKTPYVFDVSVWEIFMTLCFGAELVVCEQHIIHDPLAMMEQIEQDRITALHFVPSMLSSFLKVLASQEVLPDISSVKQVFASGEALKPGSVQQFHRLMEAELHNLYGPTEASVDVTAYETQPNDFSVPIGKPIDNIKIYILNEEKLPVPVGVYGDLYIAGVGVAEGYLNRPELTTSHFLPDPFQQGSTMYKTGDVGRWNFDGQVEYHGRTDNQVKVNGHRIELAEIETLIKSFAGVDEAIVIPRNMGETTQIFAYYQANDPLENNQIISSLKSRLPQYMIPARLIYLERLPLTHNGKLDKKALPLEEERAVALDRKMTETEGELLLYWKDLLLLDNISVDDNFFDIGGDSIKVIDLLMKVNKRFGNEIKLASLYSNPTIAKQAELIDGSADDETLQSSGSIIEIDF